MAILVIGYGNPLRQDDGLGWQVAQRLRANALAGVDVVASHQLTPELAELISRAELVVFVDARYGAEPGRTTIESAVPDQRNVGFSHFQLPGQLLGLADVLYGACPRAWTITVDGESFGHGPDLTPSVRAAVENVVQRIEALLRDHRSAA